MIILISIYLIAIVAANLSAAHFGANVTIINAFFLIGLDITTRDYLHEMWKVGRWWKLGLLIGTGSLLSWIINHNATQIAIASTVAFGAAGIVDTIAYHFLGNRPWWQKINGSNLLSSLTDSCIFPTLAFGGILPLVMLGQFGAKVGGGFLWSLVIRRTQNALASAKPRRG
jgi:hypothetical protein